MAIQLGGMFQIVCILKMTRLFITQVRLRLQVVLSLCYSNYLMAEPLVVLMVEKDQLQSITKFLLLVLLERRLCIKMDQTM